MDSCWSPPLSPVVEVWVYPGAKTSTLVVPHSISLTAASNIPSSQPSPSFKSRFMLFYQKSASLCPPSLPRLSLRGHRTTTQHTHCPMLVKAEPKQADDLQNGLQSLKPPLSLPCAGPRAMHRWGANRSELTLVALEPIWLLR